MKHIFIILSLLFIVGCDIDTENQERVVTDGEIKSQLFSSKCKEVNNVWYLSPNDLGSYFSDIMGFDLYWDTRYIEDKSNSTCNPNLEFSTTIDTRTNNEEIFFGGPQSTLIYKLSKNDYAWQNDGNLMMQVQFKDTNYQNFNTNIGGNISFNLFIVNNKTMERINYVISTYAYKQAWSKEKKEVLFDPSTNTAFVSTTVDIGNKFTTISDKSHTINTKNGFFRVNISSENLLNALVAKEFKNINLDDWSISFIGMQFEVEETGGTASLSGTFNGFEAFITTSPM